MIIRLRRKLAGWDVDYATSIINPAPINPDSSAYWDIPAELHCRQELSTLAKFS